MKYIYLIIIVCLLIACNQKQNDYFKSEAEITLHKVESCKHEIDKKYMLHPIKVKPYRIAAQYVSESIDARK